MSPSSFAVAGFESASVPATSARHRAVALCGRRGRPRFAMGHLSGAPNEKGAPRAPDHPRRMLRWPATAHRRHAEAERLRVDVADTFIEHQRAFRECGLHFARIVPSTGADPAGWLL